MMDKIGTVRQIFFFLHRQYRQMMVSSSSYLSAIEISRSISICLTVSQFKCDIHRMTHSFNEFYRYDRYS